MARVFQLNNKKMANRIHCIDQAEIDTHGTDPISHNNGNFHLQAQDPPTQQSQTLLAKIVPPNSKGLLHEIVSLNLCNASTRLGPQPTPKTNNLAFNCTLSSTGYLSTGTSFTVTSSTATSFSLFLKLPLELQFKIWKIAAGHSSIIGVKDVEGRPSLCGTSARCSLMRACKQSRKEVMKVKENINASQDSLSPRIYLNIESDTLWWTIERNDIYDQKAPALWQKIVLGPTKSVKKLALNYSMWKRRWDEMNAMVVKLDLEELILLIDTEEISPDDTAIFIKPRSEVGRRSGVWKDWDSLTKSENRQLADYLSHARHAYKRSILKGSSPEELLERGKRDLSNWRPPRITIRDIVNSRNALPEELAAIAQDDQESEDCSEDEDTDSEEGSEYD